MDFNADYIVRGIVVGIIVLQIYFFVKNVFRMRDYQKIFAEEKSWSISHDKETGFVSGIYGNGNHIFNSIKESINKYLRSHSGSVIDFQLLKDAVNRHCDAVEDDVNTLTPVPLYCGLAGTMAGVIIGLWSLLKTGSITALLSSDTGNIENAANGVNDLLNGVALAMVASICGILLTTVCSILFKRYKLKGESGKNSFLVWLQAKLLPELPSDTSDALNKLVKNLNRFNSTFAENTIGLRDALANVNESYRIQADIINAVHDMDVMKMAQANVRVLKELKECTDKLEVFNEYLDDIQGYTDAIHKFTTHFEQESSRLHVLEEIRDYFTRHKAEIAKDSADADVMLKDALKAIKNSASSSSEELTKTLIEQAEEFKRIVKEEKESFEKIASEISAQFSAQMSQAPLMQKQLAEISQIPARLDLLIAKMEKSNTNLAVSVSESMRSATKEFSMASQVAASAGSVPDSQVLPGWMKWVIVISIVIMAIACVSNTAFNVLYNSATVERAE